jgi:hypothetical protein
MSERKQVIFQAVPQPGERVWQQSFVSVQTHNDVKGGLLIPGVTKVESPDELGRYIIPANDDYYEQRVAAMKMYADSTNRTSGFKRIVGPFTDPGDAAKAVHAARPKTSEELLVEERGQRAALADENDELKRKIAELTTKSIQK